MKIGYARVSILDQNLALQEMKFKPLYLLIITIFLSAGSMLTQVGSNPSGGSNGING